VCCCSMVGSKWYGVPHSRYSDAIAASWLHLSGAAEELRKSYANAPFLLVCQAAGPEATSKASTVVVSPAEDPSMPPHISAPGVPSALLLAALAAHVQSMWQRR